MPGPVHAFWSRLLRRWHRRAGKSGNGDERVGITPGGLLALRGLTRRLALAQRRASAAAMSGPQRAAPRGRGLDFEELREYQPGDDVRSIHWGATARSGRAQSKRYREERERPLWLLVDLRAGMRFATRGRFKSVLAAQGAMAVAWRAHDAGARVGAVLLAEDGLHLIRPAAGRPGIRRLVARLCAAHAAERDPEAAAPRLARAAALLRRLAQPGCLVHVLSDFRDLDGEAGDRLTALARRTDLFATFIYDPVEAELPAIPEAWLLGESGLYPLSGEDAEYAARYRAAFLAQDARVTGLFRQLRAHLLRLTTHNDLEASLSLLLRARRRGAMA
jgi:uncharacterized protein (DUF58 family)